MTGGGSGGHITPVLAVARELKKLRPDIRIVYISHVGDAFDDVAAGDPNIDTIYHVYAGKFRRYHGEGWRQLLDVQTMYLNLRDALFVLIGIAQSFRLLWRLRPNAIFTRGSFVSVPVCTAAGWLRIPYVTHDSDVIPGLTNRLIAKRAAVHAVAQPAQLYPYPRSKTVTVGVPIDGHFEKVTARLRTQYKEELGLGGYEHVILVTGGGLGAQRLNAAVIENAPHLLERYPGLAIVHVAGRANVAEVKEAYEAVLRPESLKRVLIEGFITDMYRYTGAANIVIARAGATNLAELAVQAKPSIIVPSEVLTGGHQVKNAMALAQDGAIIMMTEDQIEQELRLSSVISDLLDHPYKMEDLSEGFAALARPDAAAKIAALLLQKAHPDKPKVTVGTS